MAGKRGPRDPEQVVPSTIAIRTDGMKPEILNIVEDFIRADGIRSAVTIAVRAFVEYCGVNVDRDFEGAIYVKPVRTRRTTGLTPEEKAKRQAESQEATRLKNFKAAKLMEFVGALASKGEYLDEKNYKAFELWFSKQTLPPKRERKSKNNAA